MSLQAARDFVDKAKKTAAIRKELHEGSRAAADIGRDHGFDFTHEEFGEALRERNIDAADGASWCSFV